MWAGSSSSYSELRGQVTGSRAEAVLVTVSRAEAVLLAGLLVT